MTAVKHVKTIQLSAVAVLLIMLIACHRPQALPPRRAFDNGVGLATIWAEASIVTTGSLKGVQQKSAPRQVTQRGTIITVYPCEADLIPAVIIKGQLEGKPRKLLWYALYPNCGFGYQPQKTSHAVDLMWFLRTDGEWLRPVADNSWIYLELYERLSSANTDQAALKIAVAKLLLTPSAIAENTSSFMRQLPDLFELACEVASDQVCYEVLGELQKRSPAEIQGPVCQFLASFYDECEYSDCPKVISPFFSGTESQRKQPARAAIPEELVRKTLEAGDKAQIMLTLKQLHLLSCNRNTIVREASLRLLQQYFPDDVPVSCVRCR